MTEESIRALARKFLKKNDLNSFPVDVKKAAEIVGAMVIFQKLPKISGVLLRGDHKDFPYIIGVNVEKSFYHRRFTIAHEIGHILLNHFKKFKILYDSDDFILNSSQLEREANIFASELLVPKDKLKSVLKLNPSMKGLCNFFQVSEQVMQYRLKEILIVNSFVKFSQ